MALRVSGKNLDIGEALRAQVVDRVTAAIAKYFDGGFSGHAIVQREGTGFRTDCTLHLASGVTLQAEGSAHDPYASSDQAAERIEKRLRRYKRRLKDRGPAQAAGRVVEAPYSVIQTPDLDEDEEPQQEFHPLVIAETKKNMRTLSVSEAVIELDLTGSPVVVFLHAGSGRVNMVYRRTDGNLGWIDPPAITATAGA
ncbi:ribosome hibernation promotion factor [Alsobacter metallidurans]|uniref:Ribosome hibernation promoting factor n=1 Tax=Alsobacter metallidurans TaxID=340221 RepID=A0A917I3E8_9HYPH|nr:ribosome-associated translation inhibitor RaiA [Alsobacter metallidurans]GGH08290.1 ribosome hibernation promotion factor [Alsobacter metallidurans]